MSANGGGFPASDVGTKDMERRVSYHHVWVIRESTYFFDQNVGFQAVLTFCILKC